MSTINKKISLYFKRKSLHHMLGSYRSNFKGTGLSFAESRVYAAGDPYNRIDRRTSAKKQDLYVKQYEEERMLRVLVVLSGGASLHFATVMPNKFIYSENVGTKIAEIAVLQGDQIGFYIDTPEFNTYIPGKRSRQIVNKRRHQIKKLSENELMKQHPLEETALSLAPYRLRHHLIIRISDQCATQTDKHLHALAKNNDLLYINLLDPFEINPDPKLLGTEAVRVQTNTTQGIIAGGSAQEIAQSIRLRLEDSERLLSSWGITSLTASTQDDPELLLVKLFKKHKLKP